MLSDLFSTLSLIEDPRIDRCKLHPLDFILLIVFTSTLSGCNSWYDIEDYAEHWQDDLKSLYKTLTGKDIIHGIPSHDSLSPELSLENKLHYCLDVFLLQDDSRKRARNVPQIMDLIQKMNLYLLQRIKQTKKSSIRRMMLNLGRMAPSQIINLKF